jgi:hypothetical protein
MDARNLFEPVMVTPRAKDMIAKSPDYLLR